MSVRGVSVKVSAKCLLGECLSEGSVCEEECLLGKCLRRGVSAK